MAISFIGIGSNVGDRVDNVRRAVTELGELGDVVAVSSIYMTSPVGGPPQRSFANAVVKLETPKEPQELLASCKAVEDRMGRESSEMRWGPRVIDLDILLYDDEKVSEPGLEIPHPRMAERRFVLIPLLEVDPGVTDPWGGRYADLLDETVGDVELLEPF